MNTSLLSITYFAGLSYPALIIAGIVAQPFASLICGSLAAAGIFNVREVFIIFFLTDIVMDCIWYVLGAHQGERALTFIRKMIHVSDEDVTKVTQVFHVRPTLVLISAKLLGGFGMMPFILFAAGASRMSFVKYISLNAFGEIFWTGGFLAIGYYFGSYVLQINGYVEKITASALVVLAVALFYWGGRRYYKRMISRNKS